MRKNHYTNQAGFTLVESLVAITIFVMVILGPITIAAKGMQSSYYANEQATAIFLAQEGLESIKRMRDDNALDVYVNSAANSWAWYTAMPAACKAAHGCDLEIKSNNGAISYDGYSCLAIANCRIKKNTNANTTGGDNLHVMYGHANGAQWPDSPYTRVIKLAPKALGANPNAAVEVTVRVSWPSPVFGNATREVVLQSWLYDQYERYEP
jgi:prepilin-type N-terminal cleavage/methylation domain-containing protein